MVSKDDRLGAIISVFELQELGMNLVLIEEELCRANECRQGPIHINKDAADKVLGKKDKKV